ncbi:MAG: hypothetical protein FJZ96_05960 [Chloroflexi bacterium]|nr:hypothetical protein [Chloroflexota bacterium]
MEKRTSLLFGITLIVLAVLALAGNLLLRSGNDLISSGAQAWPLLVIGIGLMFCLPPFIFSKVRGLGGLFIPGFPALTTGLLLFTASMSGNWGLWASFWPLEIIGLAVGFIMAAIYLRVIWLLIPALIIGINGLLLQFCAMTGAWESWAVLWTLEFASVGLPLLIIGIVKKIAGVKLAGTILCAISAVAFAAMSTLLPGTAWIYGLVGSGLILILGIYLVLSAILKRTGVSE